MLTTLSRADSRRISQLMAGVSRAFTNDFQMSRVRVCLRRKFPNYSTLRPYVCANIVCARCNRRELNVAKRIGTMAEHLHRKQC